MKNEINALKNELENNFVVTEIAIDTSEPDKLIPKITKFQ